MTYEDRLNQLVASVSPTDSSVEDRAWTRLDSLTKPPRSLGRLEELAARIACIQGTDRPSLGEKVIILAAGDHGVVEEGVSPFPQEVTSQMVANFAAGGAAINQLAESVGASIMLVDAGVASDLSGIPGVVDRKVAPGTSNMALGPAMSREQASEAVLLGAELASDAVDEGAELIATGEMGIGNTTSASALTAAYASAEPELAVGPGTGLDLEGVAHKVSVVQRALEVNRASDLDPLGVLAALGGFEIALLCGVFIGAASRSTCVVADGFISGAAALAAVRICPVASEFIFPSHLSAERGHGIVLDALGLDEIVDLDMRLGEGSGAALAMGILDAAARVLSGMATFEEAGVSKEGE